MVRAVRDRVFIRLEAKKEKTDGGIILTDSSSSERNIGVITSIGEEVHCVKVGDKVLFHDFDELPSNEEDVVVVRESSILGVFEDE